MKRAILIIIALACALTLASCGARPVDNRVVLKLDGEKINYDYFRYVYLNTKADMDGGDQSFWEGNIQGQMDLSDSVIDTLLRNKAILELAKEYDVKLTSEHKKAIKDYIANARKEAGGKDAFLEQIGKSYMTEYTLNRVMEITETWSQLYNHITSETSGIIRISDDELLDDISKNFRCIKYVMISNDASDDKEENLALAEDLLEKLKNGESEIEDLITQYGEDDNMYAKRKHGYYYTVGGIVESVQEAVEELEEGELSEIIDLGHAYFIIKRLHIDMDYAEDELETFRTHYHARVFNEMVDEKMSKIEVTLTDLFEQLNVFNVK